MYRILSLLTTLFVCINGAHAHEIGLRSFSSIPQEGFSVFFSASAEPISALQFDLEYDNSAGAVFPSPGAATRDSMKMMFVQDLDGNHKRFLIYGLNTSGIVSGPLVDVAVSPRSTRAVAVKLQGVRAVFGNGEEAHVDLGTASVSIPGAGSLPLTLSGVWNAASGQPAPVSGGTLMTLRGAGIGPPEDTLPPGGVAFSLAGYRVTFDGIPAPLIYAGPGQINVVAPWTIANRAKTQIAITRNSLDVASILAPVASATPEIFTVSMAGTGPAAVRNQDGTVNLPQNPAPVNSVIEIYGTGLGPLNPIGIDGAIAGISFANFPVSVTIGGVPAEVIYAGSAPSLISGAFQINCRIPAGVEPGPAVEVRVKAGENRSASGVTIAVR